MPKIDLNNIQSIGSDFKRDSFNLLPESFDRLRSCHYFCEKTQTHASKGNDEKAKWYLRAAIGSFQSTIDTIDGDVKNKLGKNFWRDSEQRAALCANPLVRILSKLRNFALHTARLTENLRDYHITIIDRAGPKNVQTRSVFFNKLNKTTNLKGVSNISSEEIKWFNDQIEIWPADLLIRAGLYEASKYVQHFSETYTTTQKVQ